MVVGFGVLLSLAGWSCFLPSFFVVCAAFSFLRFGGGAWPFPLSSLLVPPFSLDIFDSGLHICSFFDIYIMAGGEKEVPLQCGGGENSTTRKERDKAAPRKREEGESSHTQKGEGRQYHPRLELRSPSFWMVLLLRFPSFGLVFSFIPLLMGSAAFSLLLSVGVAPPVGWSGFPLIVLLGGAAFLHLSVWVVVGRAASSPTPFDCRDTSDSVAQHNL